MEREGKNAVFKPPINSPPAYAQQVSGVVKGMQIINVDDNQNAASGDIHIAADKNFAAEDWDTSTDFDSPIKRPATHSREEVKMNAADVPSRCDFGGVRDDENWLEDDFDS